MPQPADEKRLGELLVTTGKMSREALLAALEAQRQQGGPLRKGLGEILVEQGYITTRDLQDTMFDSDVLSGHSADVPVPLPASAAAADPIPDEVRRAMANPSCYVGRYVVLSELGRGGMGVVYRSYDLQLRREVAIKMISTDRAAHPDSLARFIREIHACAKLRHPSIVAVHEAGEHGNQPYLVMDLVDGQTLAEVIRSQDLSIREIASVTHEIAMALDHAHSAGIIHRDVKPANIMLSEKGQPVLMDFGLAREISPQQELSHTGQMLGTPHYMAPEQVKGSGIGPWTDVYALGAVLYCGLTGEPPFKVDDSINLFHAILTVEPRSPRVLNAAVPLDLETITLKCLEKVPKRRYPSATAVAEELQRFLDDETILARPISRSQRVIRWMRRNRAISIALIAVVMAVVGATVLVITQATMARQEKEQLLRLAETQRGELLQEAERGAVLREERAKILAEQEATRIEQGRARQENLETLRREVGAVLDRVRTGRHLEDINNARIARSNLLKHQTSETVRLLVVELDALSQHLAQQMRLEQGNELFLHFLCRVLGDIGLAEGAVPALGRYLNTELSLALGSRDQLRAVPAGMALCFLGGEEAERLLSKAQSGFGLNDVFWMQVRTTYDRIAAEPELEGETVAGYLSRGISRSEKGDLDGALDDFLRAIEIDPNHAGAWTSLGNVRRSKGDLDGAIADFKRAIEIDQNDVVAWNNCGSARCAKGDLEGAISDFNHAIEIDSDYALAWANRGNARVDKGDLDGAIADFTRAILIDPRFAIAWCKRGDVRYDKGDLDGAVADFSRAIEINPLLTAAWYSRGRTLQAMGDLNGAIRNYLRVIRIDPNNVQAWNNLGNARRETGDLDGAILDFNRALVIDSSYAIAWYNLGLARRSKGDLDGAIADYTRAVEADSSLAGAWINRGIGRAEKGDFDGAIADWSRAVEVDPNQASAWANRGGARIQKGDIDGGFADLTRAIEIDPSYSAAWYNRGLAHRIKGDVEGAISDWKRFLEIAPDDVQAPGVRTELQKLRLREAGADK